MPGPVSDAFDPEWGTAANRDAIDEALAALQKRLSTLGRPMYILDLVRADLTTLMNFGLCEKEWRLIRFALERARESL
jgi:hypothetical protein